jgi:hypothetical protein
MPTSKLSLSRLDDVGACVSGLCLVHCLAMPVVFAFAPTLAHLIPGDEVIHRLLAMLVLGAGLPSFYLGFRKHGKKRVLALGIAGISVILGALIFGDHFGSHLAEVGTTMMGSALLATGHLANRTFCRRCSACQH